MPPVLPLSNFSLKRVLDLEPDNFVKAKIKIAFIMIIFTLAKILLVVPIALANHQQLQAVRAAIVFILFFGALKFLLYKPQKINLIAHFVLITGIVVVWSNLIFVVQQLNIVSAQMVIMVVLCSFYLIGGRVAAVYSTLAVLPVLLFFAIKKYFIVYAAISSQQLASPGYELAMMFNFAAIATVHYLFYKAYQNNVEEKDLLNRELAVKVAEVKALADSKSLFLSTMSHELRTPLNAVIGITNLLRESAGAEDNENLKILEFSAVGLLNLVNDILDFHKSEMDKIQLENIPVDLADLLRSIFSGLRLKAAEKHLELVLDIDNELQSVWVLSDPTRLTQIIYNLVGNAIKFTSKGKVELQVRRVNQLNNNIGISFTISDTGIGIATDKLETIFEPFAQESAATTRNFGGTGLGLAIVKKLLALFNSTIRLSSTVGTGSEFAFHINFKLTEPQVNPTKALKDVFKLQRLNILIAEDNAINAMLLAKMLGNWGIITFLATNGEEVITIVKEKAIDLILMDLQMPLMNGYETAANVRLLDDPQKSGIPIIALTASTVDDIYPLIIAAGMQDFLTKPYQPIALYERLRKHTQLPGSEFTTQMPPPLTEKL